MTTMCAFLTKNVKKHVFGHRAAASGGKSVRTRDFLKQIMTKRCVFDNTYRKTCFWTKKNKDF